MICGISSQIFLPQRLTTAMLDALRDGGAEAIELWAARFHIDYTDRTQTRELGGWFRANDIVCTMHAPLTTDTHFSRHASPTVNLLDGDRGRRIEAMDEIKRALELAESMPIRSCVVHLGSSGGSSGGGWSDYALEYSLTAVEHLKAFAGPLGVKLLLENLRNEIATPDHLLEILRIGHFDSCGICLDTGHAHLGEEGLAATVATLAPRVAELHLNDNDGRADQQLWPASGAERPSFATRGATDWATAYSLLETLPQPTVAILEIADIQAGADPAAVTRLLREVLSHRLRLLQDPAAKIAENDGAGRERSAE